MSGGAPSLSEVPPSALAIGCSSKIISRDFTGHDPARASDQEVGFQNLGLRPRRARSGHPCGKSHGSDRVGSGREVFKSHGSGSGGRPDPIGPVKGDLTRENSPGKKYGNCMETRRTS